MAKRKSKSSYGKYSGIIVLLLTIATIVMFFLQNVAFKADLVVVQTEESITGMQAAFGWSVTKGSITVEKLGFSILNLLGYVLPIAGLVLALLFNKSKLMNIITFLLFVAGAVLLFLAPQTLVYANEVASAAYKDIATLGYGAIIAGITSALSAIVVIFRVFVK